MSEFTLPLIVGVGVVSIVAFYMVNTLDEEKHYLIKLITMFFILSILLLVPKAAIDETTQCEVVVNTSTELSPTQVQYEYKSFCYERTEATSTSFLENMQTYFYLVIGYVIVYLAIGAMMRLYDSVKRRGQ